MLQSELVRRYGQDQPEFEAWGRFVTEEVLRQLRGVLRRDQIEYFVRIPPSPRIKSVAGLVEKAYYRGKTYANPYEDITDKVGTRFVVLLVPEIRLVEQAILASSCWTASRDRDFEEERAAYPTQFIYQSLHYVVRAKSGVSDGGRTFSPGLPCEIQIRTLLQHAFAELTHGTLYKPQTAGSHGVERDVAKSMALIETTDEIFKAVRVTLDQASAETWRAISELEAIYRDVMQREPQTSSRSNAYILDGLRDQWRGLSWQEVSDYARSVPMDRWVGGKFEDFFLFRQPAIVLIYYLADKERFRLQRDWPLTDGELQPILTDIGVGRRD